MDDDPVERRIRRLRDEIAALHGSATVPDALRSRKPRIPTQQALRLPRPATTKSEQVTAQQRWAGDDQQCSNSSSRPRAVSFRLSRGSASGTASGSEDRTRAWHQGASHTATSRNSDRASSTPASASSTAGREKSRASRNTASAGQLQRSANRDGQDTRASRGASKRTAPSSTRRKETKRSAAAASRSSDSETSLNDQLQQLVSSVQSLAVDQPSRSNSAAGRWTHGGGGAHSNNNGGSFLDVPPGCTGPRSKQHPSGVTFPATADKLEVHSLIDVTTARDGSAAAIEATSSRWTASESDLSRATRSTGGGEAAATVASRRRAGATPAHAVAPAVVRTAADTDGRSDGTESDDDDGNDDNSEAGSSRRRMSPSGDSSSSHSEMSNDSYSSGSSSQSSSNGSSSASSSSGANSVHSDDDDSDSLSFGSSLNLSAESDNDDNDDDNAEPAADNKRETSGDAAHGSSHRQRRRDVHAGDRGNESPHGANQLRLSSNGHEPPGRAGERNRSSSYGSRGSGEAPPERVCSDIATDPRFAAWAEQKDRMKRARRQRTRSEEREVQRCIQLCEEEQKARSDQSNVAVTAWMDRKRSEAMSRDASNLSQRLPPDGEAAEKGTKSYRDWTRKKQAEHRRVATAERKRDERQRLAADEQRANDGRLTHDQWLRRQRERAPSGPKPPPPRPDPALAESMLRRTEERMRSRGKRRRVDTGLADPERKAMGRRKPPGTPPLPPPAFRDNSQRFPEKTIVFGRSTPVPSFVRRTPTGKQTGSGGRAEARSDSEPSGRANPLSKVMADLERSDPWPGPGADLSVPFSGNLADILPYVQRLDPQGCD